MDILLAIAAMSLAVMLPVLASLKKSGAPAILTFGIGCLFALFSVSSELLWQVMEADIALGAMLAPLAAIMMVASSMMVLTGVREFMDRRPFRPAQLVSPFVIAGLLGIAAIWQGEYLFSILSSAIICGLFLLAGVLIFLNWPADGAITPYLVSSSVTIFAFAVIHGLRAVTLVLPLNALFPGSDIRELAHDLQIACMLGLPLLFLGLILMLQGWMITNLRNLVARDELTGALSRRTFLEQIEELFSATVAQDASMAFMLVDIDRFKQINDRHGHGGGDKALAHCTAVIRAAVGGRAVGRLGGEEFGIALGMTDRIEASELAQKICDTVRAHPARLEDDTEIPLSVSIGVALSDTRRSLNDLISQADQALYEAKATGRDRFCTADSTPVPATASARALAGAAAQMRAAAETPYLTPVSEAG